MVGGQQRLGLRADLAGASLRQIRRRPVAALDRGHASARRRREPKKPLTTSRFGPRPREISNKPTKYSAGFRVPALSARPAEW